MNQRKTERVTPSKKTREREREREKANVLGELTRALSWIMEIARGWDTRVVERSGTNRDANYLGGQCGGTTICVYIPPEKEIPGIWKAWEVLYTWQESMMNVSRWITGSSRSMQRCNNRRLSSCYWKDFKRGSSGCNHFGVKSTTEKVIPRYNGEGGITFVKRRGRTGEIRDTLVSGEIIEESVGEECERGGGESMVE